MKSILMSIKPEWVDKILDKEKTIEVRKRFPKDYRGWVYIYCTKSRGRVIYLPWEFEVKEVNGEFIADTDFTEGNGKVVARFWCDRVYEIESVCHGMSYIAKGISQMEIAEASRLDRKAVHGYLKGKNGYGIHISKLEVFDKPKEIGEFKVSRAPQSWQWIEE